MAKKHKPEEIVAKLRQVDVLVSQGTAIADAIRSTRLSFTSQPESRSKAAIFR